MKYSINLIFTLSHTILAIGYFIVVFSAQAEVHVSDKFGFKFPTSSYEVAPRSMQPIELTGGDAGIQYQITMNANESTFDDVNLSFCDTSNLNNVVNGITSGCVHKNFIGATSFTYSVKTGDTVIIFINNSAGRFTSKKVLVDIYATVFVLPSQKQEIKNSLQSSLDDIQKFFEVDMFDLSLSSCGQSNAYSGAGGDITMCTELLFDTQTKNIKNAFAGIFAHELGHSLPMLWKDPHFDNELAADNFAAAILFIGESFEYQSSNQNEETPSAVEIIVDTIKYFETIGNTSIEAQAALLGGQHPLSVQRINNFKKIIYSPREFTEKWTNKLYPHLTVIALENIIRKPHIGADIKLAKTLLVRKKACGSISLRECIY